MLAPPLAAAALALSVATTGGLAPSASLGWAYPGASARPSAAPELLIAPDLPVAPAVATETAAAGPTRGSLGPSVPIASAKLGYTVHIRVYEPVSEAACAPLPVLYVTDGSDYWKSELGNVVETLDALIATGRMSPVIAVFIDAWDPLERRNRRYEQFLPAGTETREPFAACPFCDFIADEVVALVEARYAVDPERRGILGTSLGGLNAAYMALTRPELFPLVGIQSPSVWRQPWLAPRIAEAPTPPRKVAIDIGVDEPAFLPGARALRDAYSARGVALQYREVAYDHSWSHWRATAGEVLEFLYGPR